MDANLNSIAQTLENFTHNYSLLGLRWQAGTVECTKAVLLHKLWL